MSLSKLASTHWRYDNPGTEARGCGAVIVGARDSRGCGLASRVVSLRPVLGGAHLQPRRGLETLSTPSSLSRSAPSSPVTAGPQGFLRALKEDKVRGQNSTTRSVIRVHSTPVRCVSSRVCGSLPETACALVRRPASERPPHLHRWPPEPFLSRLPHGGVAWPPWQVCAVWCGDRPHLLTRYLCLQRPCRARGNAQALGSCCGQRRTRRKKGR